MAEHSSARLLAGALLDGTGQPVTDTGELHMAEGIDRGVLGHQVPILGQGALSHADDGGVLLLEAILDPSADLIEVEGHLGDEDDVGAARHARMQGDPSGVTAHHLDDEHAMVRLGGGVQAVDGLGGDRHGCVEAEGVVGGVEIVVDRLGYADDGQAVLGEFRGHAKGVLAADGNERIDTEVGEIALDALDATLDLDGVRARGAQDGAAARQDAAHRGDVERHGDALERALPSVAESDEFVAVLLGALADDGADDGIETGAVAATGEDSDSHGHSWIREAPTAM